jgi:hypothetical protein
MLKCLAVALFAAFSCGAQFNEAFERGTLQVKALTITDTQGPILAVASLTSDPVVIAFDISVTFEVNGETHIRIATKQRPREKGAWTTELFMFPYFAKIVSIGVLERRDPTTFMVNKYMTRDTPAFR